MRKRTTVKESLVVYGVLLFCWLLMEQPVFACNQPLDECRLPLDIKWVDLDYEKKLIYIWGSNFDNGKFPVVILAGIPLHVNYYDRVWIVATLPSVPRDIPYGQYRLSVKTGEGQKCKDRHSVKIRPAPPEKPAPLPCTPCPEQCVCPPGPPGPKGDPGISGYERIEIKRSYNLAKSERGTYESLTAACSEGKKLLGGGGGITIDPEKSPFSAPQIIYSGPDPYGEEAWVLDWFYFPEVEISLDVFVYAICANVAQ